MYGVAGLKIIICSGRGQEREVPGVGYPCPGRQVDIQTVFKLLKFVIVFDTVERINFQSAVVIKLYFNSTLSSTSILLLGKQFMFFKQGKH